MPGPAVPFVAGVSAALGRPDGGLQPFEEFLCDRILRRGRPRGLARARFVLNP